MNKQIRKRTWKYFWEQKKEEIVEHFKDNLVGYVCFSIIIGLIFQIGWNKLDNGEFMCKTLGIIGICMIGFWVLIGLGCLIDLRVQWIKENWNRAKERAEKDFKRRMKKD